MSPKIPRLTLTRSEIYDEYRLIVLRSCYPALIACVAFVVIEVVARAGVRTSPFQGLSLRDAVLYAEEHSPVMDTARRTVNIREMEYQSSWAKLLPSFDLTAAHGLQNNIPIASSTTTLLQASNPTSPWYSSLNLGVRENLYDNGQSLTGLDIARLNRDVAKVQLEKARDSLSLDVAGEFYRYSLAVALRTVRQQQKEILEKQFRILSNLFEQGQITRIDVLRLRTQLQRAELALTFAVSTIQVSVGNLQKFVGHTLGASSLPTFKAVEINNRIATPADPIDVAPELNGTFDFKISKIQKEINEKAVVLSRRLYLPQVSLDAGISYINLGYLNNSMTSFVQNGNVSWSAVLTIQYNLWDWGTRRRDLAIAEQNNEIQSNALNQGLLGVEATLVQTLAELNRSRLNFSVSQDLITLEEQSYAKIETDYRNGKVQYLDMITGANNLLDAKNGYFTTYFDFLQSKASWHYYRGDLYETLVH